MLNEGSMASIYVTSNLECTIERRHRQSTLILLVTYFPAACRRWSPSCSTLSLVLAASVD